MRGRIILPTAALQVIFAILLISVQSARSASAPPIIIKNISDLQNIRNNLSGHYVLGTSINATATSGWNNGAGFAPIGTFNDPFSGTFNGDGYSINNLTVNPTGDPSSDAFAGLFGVTGHGSSIQNVKLANVSVSSAANTSIVGGLAGLNAGLIVNASATGNITHSGTQSGGVGGLVGYNYGTIQNSFANTTASGITDNTGGLAGYSSGSILNSYSLGSASGGSGAGVGGLVGQNQGAIKNSYSGAAVVGHGLNTVGGLVGTAGPDASTTASYAYGQVTGVYGDIGGLVGANAGSTVTASYWDTQTSTQATSAGGTGSPTAQLKSGLPTGFDSSVWAAIPGQYPALFTNPPSGSTLAAIRHAVVQNAVHYASIGTTGETLLGGYEYASFTPNFNLSLQQAAQLMGFTKFNWQQTITYLPAPSPFYQNPLLPGVSEPVNLIAPPSFSDPIKGGYFNYPDQNNGAFPFYYKNAPELTGNNIQFGGLTFNVPFFGLGNTIYFADAPSDDCLFGGSGKACGGSTVRAGQLSEIDFTTALVGVLGNGGFVPLATWKWSDNFNGDCASGIFVCLSNTSFPLDPQSGTGGAWQRSDVTYYPSEVPAPGTLPLFASGIVGLGLLRWRRKKKVVVPSA